MLLERLKQSNAVLLKLRDDGLIRGFAMIGGFAVSTWSSPRATRDVDFLILVSLEDIDALVDVLRRADLDAVLYKGGLNDPVPYLIRGTFLDIIVATRKLEAESIEHSIEVELAGISIPVVSPEYLLLIKLKAGGPQDLSDVRALLAPGTIDLIQLKELAKRFKLDQKLSKYLES